MSRVISFRLDQDNPREAEALAILLDWLSRGFSTRHTITEALLQLDSENYKATDNGALNVLYQQIKELLASIETRSSLDDAKDDNSSKEELSDEFVTSILKAAKPGLKQ